jgi:hypothetical protein
LAPYARIQQWRWKGKRKRPWKHQQKHQQKLQQKHQEEEEEEEVRPCQHRGQRAGWETWSGAEAAGRHAELKSVPLLRHRHHQRQ